MLEFQKVTILTVEPSEVPTTSDMIHFRRKSTKENPVPDNQKFRAVILPSFSLPVAVTGGEGDTDYVQADNAFQLAIREAFFAAGGLILKDFCDSNKDAKEVSTELFTFSNVVKRMQEQTTSQRLNGEQISDWYDGSETAKEAAERYKDDESGKKKQASLKAHFVSLASNNPGITPSLALKMIAYISSKDAASTMAKNLIKKLEVCAKKDTSDDL